MKRKIEFNRNAFHQTLSRLEIADGALDLFSRSAMEEIQNCDWDKFGFQFTQIFEEEVLLECAVIENCSIDQLKAFTRQPGTTARDLLSRLSELENSSVANLANLAAVFISLSRFDTARDILRFAKSISKGAREAFEIAWLEFLVTNRTEQGRGSNHLFIIMKRAIEDESIPKSRVLDLCTQGVVWFTKRREISDDIYSWCVETGNAITASSAGLDDGAVSSWYRGFAMVPAAGGDAVSTRRMMLKARVAAEKKLRSSKSVVNLNGIKTYYESSIKEFTYVSPDFAAATEAATSLIELDPLWSPSTGELADIYKRFGNIEKAADMYEAASNLGPPYVGYHSLQAARCFRKLSSFDQAYPIYQRMLKLKPESVHLYQEALDVAERLGPRYRDQLVEERQNAYYIRSERGVPS